MTKETSYCCEKCYGRQGTSAGGGTYCNGPSCPCHKKGCDHIFHQTSAYTEECKFCKIRRAWLNANLPQFRMADVKTNPEPLPPHRSIGEILADFENDHDETKAVKNMLDELQRAYEKGQKKGYNDGYDDGAIRKCPARAGYKSNISKLKE